MRRARSFLIGVMLGRLVFVLPLMVLGVLLSALGSAYEWATRELPDVGLMGRNYLTGPLDVWRNLHNPTYPYRGFLIKAAEESPWYRILWDVVKSWFGAL